MPGTTFQFVAALLLCVQALFGAIRPGSTMCLPLNRGHEAAACDHNQPRTACNHQHADPCTEDRAPMALPTSVPCDTGCCLHIPIPSDPQRGERSADSSLPSAVALLESRWTVQVPRPSSLSPPDPVHDPGGRLAALRSTRLIV
ncbi:MAG: hypothetical protein KF678_05550 [Phycisphaeraceae bacterium]|nr:hypothetical protein [Phycisphaeraceae bacterium]